MPFDSNWPKSAKKIASTSSSPIHLSAAKEEKGIQNNFPGDKQTSETALLFLQLIMRKLRRHSVGGVSAPGASVGNSTASQISAASPSPLARERAGVRVAPSTPHFARAAIVVPNGTLFGDGVCARIK